MYFQAKALEKELANVTFYGSGVNFCGKEENILKSAEYHLLTGNLKKYCELKIQLGKVSKSSSCLSIIKNHAIINSLFAAL